MDTAWIESQLAEARKHAILECQRCGARSRGTCSDRCRFWLLTASESEREQVARMGANMQPRTKREWTGPRGGAWAEGDIDDE